MIELINEVMLEKERGDLQGGFFDNRQCSFVLSRKQDTKKNNTGRKI
jgi:hypothetical protein